MNLDLSFAMAARVLAKHRSHKVEPAGLSLRRIVRAGAAIPEFWSYVIKMQCDRSLAHMWFG